MIAVAQSFRKERLSGAIQVLLSELLVNRVKDPRIGFVTITEVRLSADLETARVYYSVMGDDSSRGESHKGLISAKNFLRKTIGDELKMRNTPDFVFVYDDTLDRADNIDRALGDARRQDEEEMS
jgi:ribosome-binding factor A